MKHERRAIAPKSDRIDLRISGVEKKWYERAAAAAGLSLSLWLRGWARHGARQDAPDDEPPDQPPKQ